MSLQSRKRSRVDTNDSSSSSISGYEIDNDRNYHKQNHNEEGKLYSRNNADQQLVEEKSTTRYYGAPGYESSTLMGHMLSKYLTSEELSSLQSTETSVNKVRQKCKQDITFDDWHNKCSWDTIGVKRPECKSTCASHITAQFLKMSLLPKEVELVGPFELEDIQNVEYSEDPWSLPQSLWMANNKPSKKAMHQLYSAPWAQINFSIVPSKQVPYSRIYLNILFSHISVEYVNLINVILEHGGSWRKFYEDDEDHCLYHADIPDCCTFPPYITQMLKNLIQQKIKIRYHSSSQAFMPLNFIAQNFSGTIIKQRKTFITTITDLTPDDYPKLLLKDAKLMTSYVEKCLPGYYGIAEQQAVVNICWDLIKTMPQHYSHLKKSKYFANMTVDQGRKYVASKIRELKFQYDYLTKHTWQLYVQDNKVNLFIHFDIKNVNYMHSQYYERVYIDIDDNGDESLHPIDSSAWHPDLCKITDLFGLNVVKYLSIVQKRVSFDCEWFIMAFRFALGRFLMRHTNVDPFLFEDTTNLFPPYPSSLSPSVSTSASASASSSSNDATPLNVLKMNPKDVHTIIGFRSRLSHASTEEAIADIQAEKHEWIKRRQEDKERNRKSVLNNSSSTSTSKNLLPQHVQSLDDGEEKNQNTQMLNSITLGSDDTDYSIIHQSVENMKPQSTNTFVQHFINVAKQTIAVDSNVSIRLHTDMSMIIDLILTNYPQDKLSIVLCITLRKHSRLDEDIFDDVEYINKTFSSQGWSQSDQVNHVRKYVDPLWECFPPQVTFLCDQFLKGKFPLLNHVNVDDDDDDDDTITDDVKIKFPLNFYAYVQHNTSDATFCDDQLTPKEEEHVALLLSMLPDKQNSIAQMLQPTTTSSFHQRKYLSAYLTKVFKLPHLWGKLKFDNFQYADFGRLTDTFQNHTLKLRYVDNGSQSLIRSDSYMYMGPVKKHFYIELGSDHIKMSHGFLLRFPKIGALFCMFQVPYVEMQGSFVNRVAKYLHQSTFDARSCSITLNHDTTMTLFFNLCIYLLHKEYNFTLSSESLQFMKEAVKGKRASK